MSDLFTSILFLILFIIPCIKCWNIGFKLGNRIIMLGAFTPVFNLWILYYYYKNIRKGLW